MGLLRKSLYSIVGLGSWCLRGFLEKAARSAGNLQEANPRLDGLGKELAGFVAGEDLQGLVNTFDLGFAEIAANFPLLVLVEACILGLPEELDVSIHLLLCVFIGLCRISEHRLSLCFLDLLTIAGVLHLVVLLLKRSIELLVICIAVCLFQGVRLHVGSKGQIHVPKHALDRRRLWCITRL